MISSLTENLMSKIPVSISKGLSNKKDCIVERIYQINLDITYTRMVSITSYGLCTNLPTHSTKKTLLTLASFRLPSHHSYPTHNRSVRFEKTLNETVNK